MTTLTLAQRKEIRRKYTTGKYTQTQLAIQYKVGLKTIQNIIRRANIIDRA